MNLIELGFRKYAGIQKEHYIAIKPYLLKGLNSRRPTETARRLAVLLSKVPSEVKNDYSSTNKLFTSLRKTKIPNPLMK